MSKRSTVSVITKSSTAGYAIGGIALLGAIYLLTRKSQSGASLIDGLTSGLGNVASDAGSGIIQGAGNIAGETVIGTSKKLVTSSESKTSSTTFSDQPRSNVSAWFATGGEGKVFSQPVIYKEFIQEQPLAVRVPVAAGNIITADYASQYGAYAAAETKKGQAAAGIPAGQYEERFSKENPFSQTLIGLGQALTVPFGGGGASGWGAGFSKKLSELDKYRSGKVSAI
jgi:hypothetical protein